MKIGLALGGGSARGLSHMGVIDVLNENGIKIDCVAGTSIGALVGAAFASGRHEELEKYALSVSFWKLMQFFDLSLPMEGLLEGKKATNFFTNMTGVKNIQDMKIPYAAVCCDLRTGKKVVLNKGPVKRAIRASLAVPGLFSPVKYGKMILVDGGVLDPVPVSTVKEMGAEKVIAVDLNYFVLDRKEKDTRTMKMLRSLEKKFIRIREDVPLAPDIMMDSVYLMEKTISEMRMKETPPDVLLRPRVGDISYLEFFRAENAIRIGRQEAESKIGEILALLDSK